MKKFFCTFALCLLLVFKAQAAPQQYSNVWRPIDKATIYSDVKRNHLSGVGLEQTMMRALLQSKSIDYLNAVKAASDAEPKNATLLAAYAWALAMVKNSYTFGGSSSQPVDQKFKNFDFSWQNIRDTIQRAKEMNSHCWLAYVAEASLEAGGPPPTKEAAALKIAFQINRNPVTLTYYGSALMFQAAGSGDLDELREGQRLLLMAEQRYPTYYKIGYEVAGAYNYPQVANRNRELAALKKFYFNVPPAYRHAPWVVRYFKFLDLEKKLAQAGISL